MEYQRAARDRQIERAKKLLALKDPEEIKKGPNDVRRFMKRVSKTKSGEKAVVEYTLDESKIAEEEKYDGYYAVATNLADPAKDILGVSQKRYQIDECFRIMETSFYFSWILCHFLSPAKSDIFPHFAYIKLT